MRERVRECELDIDAWGMKRVMQTPNKLISAIKCWYRKYQTAKCKQSRARSDLPPRQRCVCDLWWEVPQAMDKVDTETENSRYVDVQAIETAEAPAAPP